MNDQWLALLLADPSPCLRYLVLVELLGISSDDAEVVELESLRSEDHIIEETVALQRDDGSWVDPDTPAMLLRLGLLGFDSKHPFVERGAEYLFSKQLEDGSWPIPTATVYDGKERTGYDMIPLQTALPLCGLCACGYADDPRCEKAFRWLLDKRLPDGLWPTGISSGVFGYVAGYRRMPHSKWGCRSNTTGCLIALSMHPRLKNGSEAAEALDKLLARETREQLTLGYQTARTLGFEPTRGFFTRFALFDPGLILDLSARIGATTNDDRIANLVDFVTSARGSYGLWEYERRPQASRWVSFSMLKSLAAIERNDGGDGYWLSHEPRTPFQAYLRPRKRW